MDSCSLLEDSLFLLRLLYEGGSSKEETSIIEAEKKRRGISQNFFHDSIMFMI